MSLATIDMHWSNHPKISMNLKGNRALAEVGLGEEDSIIPSAQIIAAMESKSGI